MKVLIQRVSRASVNVNSECVGEIKKGLRPGFSSAMPPQEAAQLYDYLLSQLRLRHSPVAAGVFGAQMEVSLVNEGPVTFLLET